MTAGLSFAKLPCLFDTQDLRNGLAKIHAADWLQHVNTRDYSGQWQVVPLRCQRRYSDAHPVLQAFSIEPDSVENQWVDLPQLLQNIEFCSVLSRLQCPLKSVRLMRLNAGARIMPHRDCGVAIEYGEARLHLPIEMDPGLEFMVNGLQVPMSAGELWYINADQVHSVSNNSAVDRICLVIDCLVSDWLMDMIAAGEYTNAGRAVSSHIK